MEQFHMFRHSNVKNIKCCKLFFFHLSCCIHTNKNVRIHIERRNKKYFLINSCEPQLCWHFIRKHCLKILFSFSATRFIVRTAHKHTPHQQTEEKLRYVNISVYTTYPTTSRIGNNLWNFVFLRRFIMQKTKRFYGMR